MFARIFITMLCLTPAVATAQTPPPENAGGRDEAREVDEVTADREARREARRNERRQRWERYNNATPVERSQMRVDRMVDMTSRMYELDEVQKVMVRQEVMQVQAERRAAMGADAEELDKLREQMVEFWRTQREEDSAEGTARSGRDRRRELRDNPEFRQLREKMRAIENKYPMDWEAAAQRVEALLPPEQAERGRARRAEREARWRDRRGGEGRRGNRSERRAGQNEGNVVAGDSVNQNRSGQDVRVATRAAGAEAPIVESSKPAPVHPWEVYTHEFIKRHQLSPAQANAALAILQDSRQRGARIEASIAAELAEAEKIADSVGRQKRLAELRAPIDHLFDDLKGRLSGLLTAEQRKAEAGL